MNLLLFPVSLLNISVIFLSTKPDQRASGDTHFSGADHSLDGHAVFVHPAPSLGHPCPYVARLHPLQSSSSSSTPPVSAESLIDPPFHHSWSNPFPPINHLASHPFPTVDIHYLGQEPSPSYSHMNSRPSSADQASVPAAAMRPTRAEPDAPFRPGSYLHPPFAPPRHG